MRGQLKQDTQAYHAPRAWEGSVLSFNKLFFMGDFSSEMVMCQPLLLCHNLNLNKVKHPAPT